jgi:hypothetical protein
MLKYIQHDEMGNYETTIFFKDYNYTGSADRASACFFMPDGKMAGRGEVQLF